MEKNFDKLPCVDEPIYSVLAVWKLTPIIHPFGLLWWLRRYRIHLHWGRPGFKPWVGKIPWRRVWQPTSVYLPGESPWAKEPGGLQSIGWQRVGQDWSNWAKCFEFSHHYHTLTNISTFIFLLLQEYGIYVVFVSLPHRDMK